MPRTPTSRLAAKAGAAPSADAPVTLETLEPRIVLAATADAFHSSQYVHFEDAGASTIVDMAVGDLNGDGMDDIAVVDGNDLYVIQSFKGAYRLDAQTFDLNGATRVEMADLTGNGLLDIAVLVDSSTEMQVLINVGAGNLAAPASSQLGLIAVTDWEFVDLNADGRADPVLLSASRVRAYDTIADGTAPSGSPLFEQTSIGTANSHLAVGDIDRDGILDIAFIGTNDSNLYIKRGTGGGAAASAVTINTVTSATNKGLELIDASGNGDVEHIVAIQEAGLARSLVNTSTPGSFSVGVNGNNVTLTDGSGNTAVGDITGDGIADLILSGNSERAYAVLFGDPSAAEADYFDNASQYDPEETVNGVTLGDANGDGRLDIFGFAGSSVLIHANLGNAVFTMPEVSLGGTAGDGSEEPDRALYGDLDGDGQTDAVLFQTDGSDDNFRIKFGTLGRFGADNADIDTDFSVILAGTLADTDGDGDLDIVLFGDDGSRNQVQVFRNDGDRNFTKFSAGNIAGNMFAINDVWSGNLNAGTKQDIVLADADSERIVILTGLGTGNVTLIDRVRLGTDIFDIEVADMDGDGDNDLVLATAGGVSTLVEEGNFLYESLRTRLIQGGARAVAVGNFNPGNAPDVAAIVGDGYGEFMFFRNESANPDQPFIRPVDNTAFTLGESMFDTITAGDLDGDGITDFILTNDDTDFGSASGHFVVLEGDGFLGLRNAGYYHQEGSFRPIFSPALADLDSDGDLDFLYLSDLDGIDRRGVVIQRAYGDGSFVNAHYAAGNISTTRVPLPTVGSNRSPAVTGDFNNDGLIDLATLETSSGNLANFVVVYHNTGDGFTRVAEILLGDDDTFQVDNFNSLVAGDVNNDGRDDLVVFNERTEDRRHYTLLNTSPTGDTFSLILAHSQADFLYSQLQLADITGDGNLDILALASDDDVMIVMPGRGDGTFRNGAVRIELAVAGANFESNPHVFDADGDGMLDIAVTRDTGGSFEITLYHQVSPGVFNTSALCVMVSGSPAQWLSSSDLNNDGRPELLSARSDGGTPSLTILFNTSVPGSPTFTDQSYTLPDNTGYDNGTIAGDIDNDGRNELIVSGFAGARILELNAAGVPIAGSSIAFTTSDVGPMQLIDMDSDGDLDWVITANSLGETNGVFVVSNRFAGPSRVSNVAPAIPGGSIFLSPQTVGSSATITYEDFLALSGVTDADGDEVRFRIVSVANGTLSGPGGIITGNNTFRPGTSITYTAPNSGGASVVAFRVTLSDPFGESSVVIPVRVPLISPLTAPPAPPPAEPDTSPGWLDFDPLDLAGLDLAEADEDTIALMAGV